MARYLKKSVAVEAMRFSTNNDSGNKCLNDLVDWVKSHGINAKHNGTDLWVASTNLGPVNVTLGFWVVIEGGEVVCIDSDEQFNRSYELCDHSWEPVDDSKHEHCVFCGESRLAEIQYFGDEIL